MSSWNTPPDFRPRCDSFLANEQQQQQQKTKNKQTNKQKTKKEMESVVNVSSVLAMRMGSRSASAIALVWQSTVDGIGAVLSCSSIIWLGGVGREVVEVGRPYFTSLWELPAGLESNGLFWQCEGSPQPGHRYWQGWGPASRSRVSSGQRWKYRRPCRVCRVVSQLVFCQSSMKFSMALVLQTVYFGFQSVCKGLKLFMTWPKILVVLVQDVNVVVECFLNVVQFWQLSVQFIFDVLYLCSQGCTRWLVSPLFYWLSQRETVLTEESAVLS